MQRATNGKLVTWQYGLIAPEVAWADELRIAYRAWSEQELTGAADASIAVSPDTAVPVIDLGATRDAHHYTHRFILRLDTRGPGGFMLMAGASDTGNINNVSIATTLTVALTPGIKQARHSGWLTQGNFGATGNFELLAPAAGRGLAAYWRDNDDAQLPWNGPINVRDDLGPVDGVSMVQSNSGTPGLGRLTAAVQHQNLLSVIWRDDQHPFNWNPPYQIDAGTRGTPALVQGTYGDVHGNLELLAADADAGVRHYWTSEGDPDNPFRWQGPVFVARDLGRVDDVALCQSALGTPGLGNLALLARVGEAVYFLERDDATLDWSPPLRIADGATGSPSIIQSRFGNNGNLEVVIPRAEGGFWFLWRNNDLPKQPWSKPDPQVVNGGVVEHASLIQSTFNVDHIGNLELALQTGDQITLLWRLDKQGSPWQPSQLLKPTGPYATDRINLAALRASQARATDLGSHLIIR